MSSIARNFWLRNAFAWTLLSLSAAGGGWGASAPQDAAAPSPEEPGMTAAQDSSQRIPTVTTEPSSPLSRKQRRDLMKSNFEKMKHDADELAGLAKSLQEDLNKSNENVLSLHIVEKAEKIEKLARRIKNNARGY